ncbi:hypothetical protein Poly59_31250 [Rubripirellula reticaptiva]|uniref:Uncharacterized protein n=1 Tax=Rubripirellula reticaptiva TaxID=2528013 RepID=A0A5C6EP49_9BACT|nr:hypothetical protein Poly59_31250 [Rubripirellula reticaptiva]
MRWTEDAEFSCLKLRIFRGVSVNAAVPRLNCSLFANGRSNSTERPSYRMHS